MKVAESIEVVQDLDPDAEVLLLTQRHYPFENTLAGVTTRADALLSDDDDEEGNEDDCDPDVARGSDVFLVEGRELRYGSEAAWNAI